MVLLEPKQLGYTPLITSYCNDLEKIIGKTSEVIRNLMYYMSDCSIAFAMKYGKFAVPTDANFLISSMLKIFDCYVSDWRLEDAKIPREHEDICINAIVFAHIWSIGAASDEFSRPKIDKFFTELIG